MKLKSRLLLAFSLMTLVPILIMMVMLTAAFCLQESGIRRVYSIDLTLLQSFDLHLVIRIILIMSVLLALTALILSFWLYYSIGTPIAHLTDAAKNIRDGNLDFVLQPEGKVEEVRLLFEAFEQMRGKLKEANEEKVAFDEQNRELISNISHDLKTPITAVKGYVEGIMDGVADTPEKMDRYIRTIYNKTDDMDHLINELSFYSKITTNRIPYAFDTVDVRSFFDDAASEISVDMQSKGVMFTYQNSVPEGTAVIADVEQITRVLNNIVSNSVKYMDKKEKKLQMSVSISNGEIIAALTDNGKGIAARDLANIFERFYRTDSSRNSSAGGSGIGLSIVRKVLEDHGGRVWASSKEGAGTTIYFALRQYDLKGELS